MAEIFDFGKEKKKREDIAYIEKMYEIGDEAAETLDNCDIAEIMEQIEEYNRLSNQFGPGHFIDSDGHVVVYDPEGNSHRVT
jgi:hypothetical protein